MKHYVIIEEKSPLSAIVSLIFPGLSNNNLKQDENLTLRRLQTTVIYKT